MHQVGVVAAGFCDGLDGPRRGSQYPGERELYEVGWTEGADERLAVLGSGLMDATDRRFSHDPDPEDGW